MIKYIIIEVDGKLRSPINKKGKADRYSDPKTFDTVKECNTWILKHSYTGMSFHFEIKEIEV